jgi:hypothetical protein
MGFEDVMMKRLDTCNAEACREVLAGVKSGRSLGDAVADALESLPASKTRELRRWLEDWEAWEEWKTWVALGWSITKKGGAIFVHSPNVHPGSGPTKAAIAAGAGVSDVKYLGDSAGWGKYAGPPGVDKWGRRALISQYVSVRA